MKLNLIEKLALNNPLRAAIQTHIETPMLQAMGTELPIEYALEIGVGQGVGSGLIKQQFGAQKVLGLDLDPAMLKRAQQRHPSQRYLQADCSQLPLADNQFDGLFAFGVIHHVPDWRRAIKELTRVAKPGARFYSMEVFRSLICHPLWKRVLQHPQHDRFDQQQFIQVWQQHGWRLEGSRRFTSGLGWQRLRYQPASVALHRVA
ncbi:class I SAM-dependent methyltransferase [Ferrimonas senticii]|uniref:class I SAM-dependent methyltransferase n=1 Tax=Ferrimonas senticii TaxID=394566 RepID=UPI0004125060|nr:class I SAM-dependent methyltransferase [Ferrimonas senticii]